MLKKILLAHVFGVIGIPIFLKFNLKTLLLKDNLPFFASKLKIRYVIYTSKRFRKK